MSEWGIIFNFWAGIFATMLVSAISYYVGYSNGQLDEARRVAKEQQK